MNFNSFIFLLVFLPVTLLIYWMLRSKGCYEKSLYFLTLASIVFYGAAFLRGLPVFILSLLINYVLAINIIKRNKARLLCALGIVFDVLVLSIFKYGPLFIGGIGTYIIAPGISFYTFLEIALLVECYRGTVSKLSLCEYGFLTTFFPKLLEGPIVRPNELLGQRFGKKNISIEDIYRAILLFSFGLFKKVIIADTLGGAVDYGFNNPDAIHTLEGLVVMLSYTLQLYFDFSGYTDMAIAIAALFGFELPINFNSPYKAKNIDDFWKRWHITLTRFFTQYIYIPLGGNKKGAFRKYLNYFIIFFISGLWHGAGWQFIIWGLMHGVLFIITRFIKDNAHKKVLDNEDGAKKTFGKIGEVIKIFLTFLYVNIAWVFFRAPSVKAAMRLFKSMGELWFPRFNIGLAKCFNLDELWYVLKVVHLDRFNNSIYILMVLILILLLILVFGAKNAYVYSKECKINAFTTVIIIILLAWSLLSFEGVATYIYVNF